MNVQTRSTSFFLADYSAFFTSHWTLLGGVTFVRHTVSDETGDKGPCGPCLFRLKKPAPFLMVKICLQLVTFVGECGDGHCQFVFSPEDRHSDRSVDHILSDWGIIDSPSGFCGFGCKTLEERWKHYEFLKGGECGGANAPPIRRLGSLHTFQGLRMCLPVRVAPQLLNGLSQSSRVIMGNGFRHPMVSTPANILAWILLTSIV